jgi:hypothetical protein
MSPTRMGGTLTAEDKAICRLRSMALASLATFSRLPMGDGHGRAKGAPLNKLHVAGLNIRHLDTRRAREDRGNPTRRVAVQLVYRIPSGGRGPRQLCKGNDLLRKMRLVLPQQGRADIKRQNSEEKGMNFALSLLHGGVAIVRATVLNVLEGGVGRVPWMKTTGRHGRLLEAPWPGNPCLGR